MKTRPYRDPHHSASLPALIGGGQKAKPGEISLAHHGVLFLDELPEFARGAIESMRQPLESGSALIARANNHVTYPARFQLIAAMNPCRCGYLGDADRECTRAPRCGQDYQAKISGPMIDRMDICVDVPPVSIKDLTAQNHQAEDSAIVAARVLAARELQARRYKDVQAENPTFLNAHAPAALIEKMIILQEGARELLNKAAETMRLSARSYHRILRVSRTIADLGGGCGEVKKAHIAEALGYRAKNFI